MIRARAIIVAAVVAVGLSLSLATAAQAAPPPAQAVSTASATSVLRSYLIQPGDTLTGIAARFCGSASQYRNLAAGNGIRNPDLIYAGRWLRMTCLTRTPEPIDRLISGVRIVSGATVASRSAPRVSVTKAQEIVAYALAQVGKPYVWGAAGPRAYDCSGLVMAALARVGVHLPHQSEAQRGYGRAVTRAELRPGDIVFPFVGHVVIYIGGGRIVEAADPQQGVRINNLYAFQTARRYV